MKAKIFISGEIGVDFHYLDLVSQVRKHEMVTSLEVEINSVGGYVVVGVEIYNYLRGLQIPIETVASGVCASIATVIFLAGDKRRILDNAKFMIHAPFVMDVEKLNASEAKWYSDSLMKTEKELSKIYTERTKLTPDEVSRLLQDDTYMNAEQLMSLGFVTENEPSQPRAVAKININQKEKSMNVEDKNWIESKFEAIAKMFGGRVKMLSLQDATGATIEFPDLEDNATPKVDDRATVDGAPANGTYVMPSLNNASVTFVDGLITAIDEASEGENEEVELLKAENEALKKKVEEYENSQATLATEFKNFRAQVTSKLATSEKTDAKKPTEKTADRPTSKYLENLKNVRK